MNRFCTLIIATLIGISQSVAQDKILVAGSGNSYVSLVDKTTGKIEWKHSLEKGEECNSVALTRQGDILYSYRKGAKVVTWNHQVVWDYKVPDGAELQSATLLRNGGVLLGICGTPARFVELDKKGKVVNEATLSLNIERPHSQFRQIFQLKNKNYLIPVMSQRKIVELDRKGTVIAEHQIDGRPFSSLELKDGTVVLPCGDDHRYIVVDRKSGKELRRVANGDLKGIPLLFVAQILELKDNHLLICNWNGHTKGEVIDAPSLIEVDESGQVVWTLNDKENIGKISAAYYLPNFRQPRVK